MTDQWTMFDFVAMQVQDVNNNQGFLMCNQRNMSRVISSLTMQMFTKRFYSRFILCWVKAVDGFQSFFQTRSAINCTTDIV